MPDISVKAFIISLQIKQFSRAHYLDQAFIHENLLMGLIETQRLDPFRFVKEVQFPNFVHKKVVATTFLAKVARTSEIFNFQNVAKYQKDPSQLNSSAIHPNKPLVSVNISTCPAKCLNYFKVGRAVSDQFENSQV